MSTPDPARSSTPETPEPAAFARRPSRAVYRLALLALAVLGGVVGLFSGLQVTRLVLWGPVHISVGAVAALAANAGLGAAAAWALRTRDAAIAPGVGWFVVVLALLFLPHPGGDVLIPESGGDAIAFLVLGFLGLGLAGGAATFIAPRPIGRPRQVPPALPPRL